MVERKKLARQEVRPNHNNLRSRGRLLRTVIVALGLCGCAHHAAEPTTPAPRQTPEVTAVTEQSEQRRILRADWGTGECRLNIGERKLTYQNDEGRRSIFLDAQVDGATEVHCSDRYTVIVSPTDVIIALGGESVLSEREMLGMMGARMVHSNSYSIGISEFAQEGVTEVQIRESLLVLSTKEGRWSLDMSNPDRWRIY